MSHKDRSRLVWKYTYWCGKKLGTPEKPVSMMGYDKEGRLKITVSPKLYLVENKG